MPPIPTDAGFQEVSTSDQSWTISVLGPLVVAHSDRAIEIPRRQVRDALIKLALAGGEWLATAELEPAAWLLTPPKNPEKALLSILAKLRSALGDQIGAVSTKHGFAKLDRQFVATDVERFVAHCEASRDVDPGSAIVELEGALRLWRGDPMGEAGNPARGRLQVLHLDARTRLAVSYLDLDRVGIALHLIQDLRAADREDEELAMLEIRALASTRFHEALRVGAEYREQLAMATGLSPSDAFNAFISQLQPRPASNEVAPTPGHVSTSGFAESQPSLVEQPRERLAADTLPEVRRLRQKGELAAAISMAQSVANYPTDPGEAELAQAEWGVALEVNGDFDEAEARFDALVDIGKSPEAVVRAAIGSGARASRIGGDSSRLDRLLSASMRFATSAETDRLIPEIVLELLQNRSIASADTLKRLATIAADPASPGYLLGRRAELVLAETAEGASALEAAEIADLAMHAGFDGFDSAAALTAAIHVALTSGAWDLADGWSRYLASVGATDSDARATWMSATCRSTLMDARGRTSDADALSKNARSIGTASRIPAAGLTRLMFKAGRSVLHGSLAPVRPIFEQAAEEHQVATWYVLLGLSEFDSGMKPAAQQSLELAVDELHFQADTLRPGSLALAAFLACRLQAARVAAELLPMMETREPPFVFLGYGGPFLGPMAAYRGALRRLVGDHDAAEVDIARAHAAVSEVGAVSWTRSRVRDELNQLGRSGKAERSGS